MAQQGWFNEPLPLRHWHAQHPGLSSTSKCDQLGEDLGRLVPRSVACARQERHCKNARNGSSIATTWGGAKRAIPENIGWWGTEDK